MKTAQPASRQSVRKGRRQAAAGSCSAAWRHGRLQPAACAGACGAAGAGCQGPGVLASRAGRAGRGAALTLVRFVGVPQRDAGIPSPAARDETAERGQRGTAAEGAADVACTRSPPPPDACPPLAAGGAPDVPLSLPHTHLVRGTPPHPPHRFQPHQHPTSSPPAIPVAPRACLRCASAKRGTRSATAMLRLPPARTSGSPSSQAASGAQRKGFCPPLYDPSQPVKCCTHRRAEGSGRRAGRFVRLVLNKGKEAR